MTRLSDVPLWGARVDVPLPKASVVDATSAPAKPAPEEPVAAPRLIASVPPAVLDPSAAAVAASSEEPAASPARAVEEAGDESTEAVDWGLVVTLRRQASEEIAAAAAAHQSEHDRPMPEADRRMMGRSIVRSVVRGHAQRLSTQGRALWSMPLEQAYAQAVENAIFGYGRLQPLFEIETAENIEINGCDRVQVQYGSGERRAFGPVADSDGELIEAIRFLGESARPARPFDEVHPTMTLALGDKFRLHAIGFGLSHRPSITIRRHTMTDATLPQLVDTGMLSAELASLLDAAVKARKSMVIAGDQGYNRILTMEDFYSTRL